MNFVKTPIISVSFVLALLALSAQAFAFMDSNQEVSGTDESRSSSQSANRLVRSGVFKVVMNCGKSSVEITSNRLCSYVDNLVRENLPDEVWVDDVYSSIDITVSRLIQSCYSSSSPLEVCNELKEKVGNHIAQ